MYGLHHAQSQCVQGLGAVQGQVAVTAPDLNDPFWLVVRHSSSFMYRLMMAEKSRWPLPAKLMDWYSCCARAPITTGCPLTLAASVARPRSLIIRSMPKPPV